VHIFLMKFSSKYEILIKKQLAHVIEFRELKRLSIKEKFRFHMNL
jgi:hypothetical protein